MSLFGKKPKTAMQKAQWARTSLMLRAVALGYLIFFIVIPMINPDPEEVESIAPAFRYAILAFFIIACLWVSVLTILEYLRGKKTGRFTAEGHEDDEGVESYAGEEEPAKEENDNDDNDDDDDDDDDYYDDDDDDDDDYDDDYEEEDDEEITNDDDEN